MVSTAPGQVVMGAQAEWTWVDMGEQGMTWAPVTTAPGQASQQRMDQIVFERKEYDVANSCDCGTTTKLILEPDQVVLIMTSYNNRTESKVPYGEVGAVDKSQQNGRVTTNVLGHTIDPGCCGNMSAVVEEIVEEMNRRIGSQTKLALTKRAEHHFDVTLGTANKLLGLESKLDLMLSHLGVTPEAAAPSQVLMQANVRDKQHIAFEQKEYDVATSCEKCCGTRRNLILEPEQVVFLTTSCNNGSEKKVPYGEMGAVDRTESNGHTTTCVLGEPIDPGRCGNMSAMVGEIIEELNRRIASQTKLKLAQRAQQHLDLSIDLTDRTSRLEAKLELILGKVGCARTMSIKKE